MGSEWRTLRRKSGQMLRRSFIFNLRDIVGLVYSATVVVILEVGTTGTSRTPDFKHLDIDPFPLNNSILICVQI